MPILEDEIVVLPSAESSRMSMMSATRAASYREMEILSAPPERLVVMLFDQLVVQLERGRIGMERGQVELRVTGLQKARAIVSELLATLDFERGGEIAARLADLYQYLLLELIDIGQRGDLDTMRKLVQVATQLRDGFAGAAESLTPARLSA
jgi:flagellar protein FliS